MFCKVSYFVSEDTLLDVS